MNTEFHARQQQSAKEKQRNLTKALRRSHGAEGFAIVRNSAMKIELRFPVKVMTVTLEPSMALLVARAIIDATLETGIVAPEWFKPVVPTAGSAGESAGESDGHDSQENRGEEEAGGQG